MLKKAWKVITDPNKLGKISIYTNHQARPLLYYHDLSSSQRREAIDLYCGNSTQVEDALYFEYKGQLHTLDDYMRIEKYAPAWMKDFDGYSNDSFFSGTLIKLTEDNNNESAVIVYTYIS